MICPGRLSQGRVNRLQIIVVSDKNTLCSLDKPLVFTIPRRFPEKPRGSRGLLISLKGLQNVSPVLHTSFKRHILLDVLEPIV